LQVHDVRLELLGPGGVLLLPVDEGQHVVFGRPGVQQFGQLLGCGFFGE
jgi:hypothetical protein